jgi:agmatine deiminase
MPAEWEPHEATWIAWPHNRSDWPGKFAAIPSVYTEIVRHLHRSERVRILVNDENVEGRAREVLGRAGIDLDRIDFFTIPTDRSWTRDYGPWFLQSESGTRTVADWAFNAWAKYPDWQRDDAVARQVAAKLEIEIIEPRWKDRPIVLEGGAIDVNGHGLMLTTEECLLSTVQGRNPALSRSELEEIFECYLGVHEVIWLGRGIAGDDTHGHIDDIARFVDVRTVVAAREPDPGDFNHEPLEENWQRLQSARNLDGERLRLVELPMPDPVYFKGTRLPASYANFYIANDRVLVPTFNDPRDRQVLGILQELFPSRQIVGIYSCDLVWGLGTIHCLTQQEPKPGLR